MATWVSGGSAFLNANSAYLNANSAYLNVIGGILKCIRLDLAIVKCLFSDIELNHNILLVDLKF